MNPKPWLQLGAIASFLWAIGLGWWGAGLLRPTPAAEHEIPQLVTFAMDVEAGRLGIQAVRPVGRESAAPSRATFDVSFALTIEDPESGARINYTLESSGIALDDPASIVLTQGTREMYELVPLRKTWRQILRCPRPAEELVVVRLEGASESGAKPE